MLHEAQQGRLNILFSMFPSIHVQIRLTGAIKYGCHLAWWVFVVVSDLWKLKVEGSKFESMVVKAWTLIRCELLKLDHESDKKQEFALG